ncbi:ComEC/Rec2 family competence protein [Sphingobium nicotianae]|uniref:ComEC/Rec2 family competence protein n=1 Tax=Sphingobium nicotianae TaxID=2782607 RepID=A0A9X1DBK2_9SPHN|nr:ComEC/Rec2 family competence protein [Sphingobium nicotianae]MBT2186952.1 ComEC/Rec2 family competence protein [Sphingobium nicotianae]
MPLLRRSKGRAEGWLARVETLLEAERAQLPLWVPVALGAGICAWFALPTPQSWIAWVMAWLGIALAIGVIARGGRLAQVLAAASVLLAAGCLLVWAKAMLVGAPPLAHAAVVDLTAQVRSVDPLAARSLIRLDLSPVDRPDLPERVRVNAKPEEVPTGLVAGDRIAVRARLMPPAPQALPGGYDYAERAYFDGIGASGRALGSVQLVAASGGGPGLRERLAAHIATRLSGGEKAIAITLATGDQNGISEADAEAMRRSGLAHLLSISGLHVSALISGVIFLVYRLLALSQRLALHWPIILIAACAGAAAGIGYTLLTGAQVPTVRSCIAALLVIGGLALGREAISLRLIATGALFVMLFWPDAVVGPSFQMSFAAVTAIVALYEYPPARALFEPREESRLRRFARHGAVLLVTGLTVEIVLAPIALAHFHRAGLLGAGANMIAIPLTSFVVMPAEALALLLDVVGLGAPAWWVVGSALRLLLGVAHLVAAQPYATMAVPVGGDGAFVLTMAGFLWMMLWHGRVRWLGAPLAVIGLALTLTAPEADLLVTADGRHVALHMPGGGMALLRDRAGDYVRDALAEAAAYEGEFAALAETDGADCSPDLCEVILPVPATEPVHLLVTRSSLRLPWEDMVAACARADLAIADRLLPRGCTPRWIKLDRPVLSRMGGVLIMLKDRRVIGGRDPRDRHPWLVRASSPRF